MKNKNGFTMVELIAVISIIALLLIITIPTISKVSENSKMSLRKSKINTIEISGTKYADENINSYQECTIEKDSIFLANNCRVDLQELIDFGYLETSESIEDPITNHQFEGDVIVCYDEKKIEVNAYFQKKGTYTCNPENIEIPPVVEPPKVIEMMVTFDPNEGTLTENSSKIVEYDKEYGELPSPSRPGYLFEGWYTEVSGGTLIESGTKVKKQGDHTLYARWTRNAFSLSFEANGGTEVPSQTLEKGTILNEFPTTTREDYIFDGWFTELEGGVEVTEITIESDTTLYAHWSKIKYNLIYDSNGGSSVAPQSYDKGTTVTTFPVPVRTGYQFDGWFTMLSGGTEVKSVEMTSNKTLFAHWTKIIVNYTLTFKNSDSTTVDSRTVEDGTTVSDFPTLTKEGYTFAGWFTAITGGTKVTSIRVTSNITLYAQWKLPVSGPEDTLDKLGVTPKPGTPDFSKTAPEIKYKEVLENRTYTTNITDGQRKCFLTSTAYTFNKDTGKFDIGPPYHNPVGNYLGATATINKYMAGPTGWEGNPVCFSDFTSSATDQAYIKKYFKDKYSIIYVENVNVTSTSGGSTSIKMTYRYLKSIPDLESVDHSKDGVYAMDDDYGKSYYFRGSRFNNYVKFAGFYWRIIRVNGDGTLRIIYDGDQAFDEYHTGSEKRYTSNTYFNERATYTANSQSIYLKDNKYLGYMYNPSTSSKSTSKTQAQTNRYSSKAKTTIDNWYKNNIVVNENYSKYISDRIFCNDRSTAPTEKTWAKSDTTLGYGKNTTYFGIYNRVVDYSGSYRENPTVSFKCAQQNDAFTVDDTEKGNGALKYPVGLITADEVMAAGANYTDFNRVFYLYKNSGIWTMTPYRFYTSGNNSTYDGPYSVYFTNYGQLSRQVSYYTAGLAPVINLSLEFVNKMTGDGSKDNPFQVIE